MNNNNNHDNNIDKDVIYIVNYLFYVFLWLAIRGGIFVVDTRNKNMKSKEK